MHIKQSFMKKVSSPRRAARRRQQQLKSQPGFTIVELLIVIVIIGILASIVIVAYNGIQQKARVASLQSDMSNATSRLEIDNVNNGTYPASATVANSSAGLKASTGTTYQYTYTSSSNSYCLTGTNSGVSYFASSTNPTPQAGACSGDVNGGVATLTCPSGFIVVPGSNTYGTSDFCTMKYEAKQVGSTTTPVSQTAGLPWTTITQTDAIANSPNVAGCTGCHLITEAEWLTIAQNVLSVASNWSGGAVGGDYIYSGHNDSVPANTLAADANDTNGYSSTGNSSPSNQRRTLTLSTGAVIWDLAGNVWEWTAGQTTGGQPGVTGETGYAWKEWAAVTVPGTLSPNPSPNTTGLAGASTWNSVNGVGWLYSYSGETAVRAFYRSGAWDFGGGGAGVLALSFGRAPSSTSTTLGFRVSR